MITMINFNGDEEATVVDDMSMEELRQIVKQEPNVRGNILGYRAEFKLRQTLAQLPGVTNVVKISDWDHTLGKFDFLITYKDVDITMEVKCIGINKVKRDTLNDTWQGVVNIKNTDKRKIAIDEEEIETYSVVRGTFDVLAICCWAVSKEWDFAYILEQFLPSVESIPSLLKTSLTVNPHTTICLEFDIVKLLDEIHAKKVK